MTLPGSCLLIILFELNALYDGYFNPIYEHHQEFINLLELSHTKIDDKYVSEPCNPTNLQETLEWLTTETQTHFFNRTGERYSTPIPEWIINNPQKVFKSAPNVIDSLGNSKLPHNLSDKSENTCIAILGSTDYTLKRRMESLKEMTENGLLHSDSPVYLLTSHRKLFPHEISTEKRELLEKIYGPELTESNIMEYMYKNMFGKAATTINATPCNLPETSNKKCSRARANTEDTVYAFLENINYCTNIVFISSAPDITAQEAAITTVMQKTQIEFEVVGRASHFDYHVMSDAELAKAIHQRLMPFAGTLFGSFERLSAEISLLNGECPLSYEELTQRKLSIVGKS